MPPFDYNPGMSSSGNPAYAGMTPGPGGTGARPNPSQRNNNNASPLHSLITPEVTVPFDCNILPGPDAAALSPAITAQNVGYFGLQLVDGNTHGIVKLCGVNAWISPTFNQYALTTFPATPTWATSAPQQLVGYGNLMGTGAGLFVALSNDLPFTPRVGQWVAGPALASWLQPNTGTFTQNIGANKQVWGTPFAPGCMEVDQVSTKELVVRDAPLGWDVPRTSQVWVLIAVDGAALVDMGDAANAIFASVQGNLVAAAEKRRFGLE